jgi:hypothetical protein
MDLCFGPAMPHRTEQCRIDSGQPSQRPGIEPIVFSATCADQAHVARVGHNHFVSQLAQLPANPRRMRSGF